nr:ribonuclease H-like domain-containing protein [Tanacetum cinerariifolium]
MDVEVEKDDLNQKFLTSLALEWLTHTNVWRNRNDLDSMSLDDLYNHVKVYEAEVQKKSNPILRTWPLFLPQRTASMKMATLYVLPLLALPFPLVVLMLPQSVKTLLMHILLLSPMVLRLNLRTSTREPKSQEKGRKESYRQGSKAEEKSSKALMAIDGVGWDWIYMANEEDHALVDDGEAPTEFALMANIENKLFDNSLCLNECKKNTDSLNSKIKDLKSELSEANNFIYHYKLPVAQLEGRLTEYKEREEKYIVTIRTLEMYRASNLDSIKIITKELEEAFAYCSKYLSRRSKQRFFYY